jgi:hypothetical protein
MRRRVLVLAVVGAAAAAFLLVLSYTVLHKAPSCGDGVQNQGEAGVDCGGPCPYLCQSQVQPPTILYTKTLPGNAGRTDVVASIENKNAAAAAKGVPYTITLYGAGQAFVQQISGTIDLLPAATVPVYVSGIPSGNQAVVRAFLTIDPAAPRWYAATGAGLVRPIVTNTLISGTATSPRIDATLSNPSIKDLADIPVVIFVHDAQGAVIAASKTIVADIPAQGTATATFTWNGAFPSVPAALEVMPVAQLP